MTKPPATLTEVQAFFGTQDNPVSTKEFKDFWATLSNEEKDFIKREVADN